MNKWLRRMGLVFGYPVVGFFMMLGWVMKVIGERHDDRVHQMMVMSGDYQCYLTLQKWRERAEKHDQTKKDN